MAPPAPGPTGRPTLNQTHPSRSGAPEALAAGVVLTPRARTWVERQHYRVGSDIPPASVESCAKPSGELHRAAPGPGMEGRCVGVPGPLGPPPLKCSVASGTCAVTAGILGARQDKGPLQNLSASWGQLHCCRKKCRMIAASARSISFYLKFLFEVEDSTFSPECMKRPR